MTAREYLEQYEEANRITLRCKTEYEKELELIDTVRSTLGGDGMPHGSGVSKHVEDQAIRLADKALKWKEAELNAIRIRSEVFETVLSIGGLESEVLIEKYIYLKTWEKVCESVHYSWESVRLAWHRGEDILEEIISSKK